jgi:hypothetical protein
VNGSKNGNDATLNMRRHEVIHGSWGSGRHAHHAPAEAGRKEEAAFIEKVKALTPKYWTELLRHA